MDLCTRCTSLPATRPRLSPQETIVLQALAWYGNNIDVSTSMHLSPATVSTLLNRIRRKYALAERPAPNQLLLIRAALQDHVICLHHLLGHHREHTPAPLPCPEGSGRTGPRYSVCCTQRTDGRRADGPLQRVAPHTNMPHCQH